MKTNRNQLKEISKITKHISVDLTAEEIELLALNLFGGTATFHKGLSGEWKKVFTQEHCKAFKRTFGKDLIMLGYEKDNGWSSDN